MLDIKNANPQKFKEYMKEKRVFIYGAGRALESCLDIYFQDAVVEGVIDSNPKKIGEKIDTGKGQTKVISRMQFIRIYEESMDKDQFVLFISSPVYAAEIVDELDRVDELDGLKCFLQVLVRNTFTDNSNFDFTNGKEIIPRKIHYIWIGGKALPDEFKKNIESWKKNNPSYEIIQWDESNYDFRKTDYMRWTYDKHDFGFTTNYARLDILNQNGGIYLDTDVEAVSSFDVLLKDKTFFNMGCADRVNMGCGFGTISNQKIIWDIMSQFENCKEEMTSRPYHNYVHPILKKYGFELSNCFQRVNGIVLYPSDVMSPLTINGLDNNFSKNTVSIHKEAGTWMSKTEKQKSGNLENIMERVSSTKEKI